MIHHYFPHTEHDLKVMLDRCGVDSVDDLYADVPESLLLKREYNLPESMSETEVRDFFSKLNDKNTTLKCFAGGGYYNHYVPSVIPYIISRSEFLTAYTPYQPEISQGTLQYIFEYQSMMTRLTGLDVSNASMYDGATATAEAMMMMVASARKKNRVLVSATILPQIYEVMKTYAHYHGISLDIVPEKDGMTDRDALSQMLKDNTDVAGVVVAQPNRYGIIEDYSRLADEVHAGKGLLAMNCVASTLAALKTPGEWGADIAAGDGQSLGMPLNYGGPYIGFMTCTKALIRKLPGRIVGATLDSEGRRVFVLTLQAREQHIRREKATSNICSNQGLMSLYVTIYMGLMGTDGLQQVNRDSAANAHYLADALTATGKVSLKYPGAPFLNEFAVTTIAPADDIINTAVGAGINAGIKLGDHELLIAAPAMLTKAVLE
ncbi:MAG: aminomethyl-transferring glycine dehydrogenase subunit GcvPA, partial [Muribaculum sp.]|nr:aminomethyl-transferring glycine dehydrogenase subunit GcvPA [Muribaculum sp.]